MKYIYSTTALMFFSMSLLADAELKIAYVNFDTAFNQELKVQEFIKRYEEKEKVLEEQKNKAEVSIKNKVAALQKLTGDARLQEEAKLSAEFNSLQTKLTDESTKISNERQKEVKTLEDENRFWVESLAKEGGYSIVLNSATIVYLADSMKKHDLTSKLIAKYNQANPLKPSTPAAKAPPAKKPTK
jgi:Skp family chaperone for outer membrane proteins